MAVGIDPDRRRIAPRVALSLPSARKRLVPAIFAIGLAGASSAAYAAALLYEPAEHPAARFSSIFFARAALLALLALGLAWAFLDVGRARAALARLGAELEAAPRPGTLEQVLASAVGDPKLEVAYWARSKDRYVDARGQPTEPPRTQPGRAATPIVRAGEPMAIVGHDAAVLDGDELAERIGSTARLAADNERLQAEILGSSPTSGPRELASSRPPIRPGVGSSATCTTVRSSACSPSRTSSASRSRAHADGDESSGGFSRPPSRRQARQRCAARARARNLPRSARRGRNRPGTGAARRHSADFHRARGVAERSLRAFGRDGRVRRGLRRDR